MRPLTMRPSGVIRSLLVVCVSSCIWNRALAQTITPTTKSVTLAEKEASTVELLKAGCTSKDAGKSCSVDIQNVYPSNPCGDCFTVLPCGGYCLRYLPGQGFLNPRIEPRYILTLVATDEDSNQVRTVVDVHIMPNNPPYFDPVTYPQMTKSLTLSNGVPVSVTATDTENDALTYSMITVPDVSGIEIDSLSGQISATRDLQYVCRDSVTALVYVQDAYHSDQEGPLTVSLSLQDSNERPIINNLNSDLYVREDEAVGTTVLPLAVYDGRTNSPVLEYTLTTVPTSAQDLFQIINNELVVNSALDYESQPKSVTMSIQASDDYCDSELYTLTVRLVDVNEPPTLLPVDQTLESCEGLVDITPNWNASDPDEHDAITFANITPNNNGRFKIDETTGVVSTTIDYDLDEAKMAATVVSIVTITDRQGETATATLTIRFQDCNDNPPVFPASARDYLVRDCWAAGTVVGSVANAEDADSSFNQNNVFSYAGSGTGAAVQPSGSIVISETFSAGQSLTFPVYATDQGMVPGPLTSKPFWVSLYTLPCLEPTSSDSDTTSIANDTVAANDVDFWDGNLAWFIPLMLLVAALTALILYMLWRYCWTRLRQCCARTATWCKKKPPPPRPITPARRPTPPPTRPGPGFIFGWWKETYPNNDYEKGRQPDRNSVPEPSKGPEAVNTNTFDVEPVLPPTPTPPPKRSACCNIL